METMVTQTSPSIGMNILGFLQLFAQKNVLFYTLPTVAIFLILFYVILERKRVAEHLGETYFGFFQGVLLAALLTTAFLAVGNYFDGFGKWRYGTYFNAYEFYHYYLGSKYSDEIAYTNLYAASLIADDETGLKYNSSEKTIRDLATGRYIPVADVLKNRDQYKSRFSPERWQEWLKDVRFFKRELVSGRWNGVLRDKGYNATPVWSMIVGGLFSNRVSTDNRAHMLMLACLDPLLISLALLCIVYAFGPRPALIMVILVGTHYMMKWSHMKGAYLRTDFAMCLVMAICMIKKDHYRLAGALTAYSVLSRIFPGVFLFGLGAKLFWELCRVVWVARDAIRMKIYDTKRHRQVVFGGLAVHALAAIVFVAVFQAIFYKYGPEPFITLVPGWLLWVGLFPAVSLGLVLATCGLWGWWVGHLDKRYVHFFVSFAITVALLVGASIIYSGGLGLWKDYGDKIGRHNKDISPWRVGYKYIFIAKFNPKLNFSASFSEFAKLTWDALRDKPLEPLTTVMPAPAKKGASPSTPPTPVAPKDWKSGVTSILKDWEPFTRSIIYTEQAKRWWITQAIVLIICLFAVKGLQNYQAMAFSFAPCFFLVSPTYYYYIMLAVPLLFFTPEISRPSRAAGVIWLFISGMMGYYFYSMWQQRFATYYYLGYMLMLLVIYMILLALAETAIPYIKRLYRAVNRANSIPVPTPDAVPAEPNV